MGRFGGAGGILAAGIGEMLGESGGVGGSDNCYSSGNRCHIDLGGHKNLENFSKRCYNIVAYSSINIV